MSEPYNNDPVATTTTSGTALAHSAFQHKQEPDPTIASIDALRSAVVAQTALLRELSQQMRLSSEAQQAEYLSQQFEVAKQLAALAERLDKLASWLEAIQHRQGNILGQICTANQAYSDGMAQGQYNHSFTRKKSKHRKAKPKRKAAERKDK